ncbi:MAG: hypothetical protein BWY20_02457 [Spirochaetes bacterium ADurb.Bin215]|nr:MAG: hypothetical protein BWY20_02457 [Spirochaetes bacterium ADurb.Bin215]
MFGIGILDLRFRVVNQDCFGRVTFKPRIVGNGNVDGKGPIGYAAYVKRLGTEHRKVGDAYRLFNIITVQSLGLLQGRSRYRNLNGSNTVIVVRPNPQPEA